MPTLGSGEIRVQGKYKAYGQDLTIQQGQLLYASTPLDNPGLGIEATSASSKRSPRACASRGTAQTPELTIFSDPPMSQANALSYLVAGKPLDDLGSDEEDGDAVQAAARSLGAAGGGLLAKNIGSRLGVDEFGVKDDEMIGGAALTVGQYLSPRLYLSYGVGLFEPGEVVTLRYKLKKDLSVQTQRGPEDTRYGDPVPDRAIKNISQDRQERQGRILKIREFLNFRFRTLAILAILAREFLVQAATNLMRVISDGAPKRFGGPQ